jgi:hypothetical protein
MGEPHGARFFFFFILSYGRRAKFCLFIINIIRILFEILGKNINLEFKKEYVRFDNRIGIYRYIGRRETARQGLLMGFFPYTEKCWTGNFIK